MKYECVKQRYGLTPGKHYTEIFPHPCPFNACVWNDEGEPLIVPRKIFFKSL